MTPGRTTSPEASIVLCALGALELEPIQVTLPAFEAIAQVLSDDETATLPSLMTRSAELKIADGPKPRPHYLLIMLVNARLTSELDG